MNTLKSLLSSSLEVNNALTRGSLCEAMVLAAPEIAGGSRAVIFKGDYETARHVFAALRDYRPSSADGLPENMRAIAITSDNLQTAAKALDRILYASGGGAVHLVDAFNINPDSVHQLDAGAGELLQRRRKDRVSRRIQKARTSIANAIGDVNRHVVALEKFNARRAKS